MLKLPASALQAGYLFIFKVNCFRSVHLLEGGQWGGRPCTTVISLKAGEGKAFIHQSC